ncbi:hypothetical protein [Comamonas sp. JC664]|uniref:hypothetical protein n=1 Tax=Comamonas sp. JC664 TaxID=2801917 RepID=UPI00174C252F|nr:hypothetical protein [Comamonas sp. JC664]MBL0695367.1 hypothetical protein [Comamonas sp. JC664]GHG87658.1 hypothetical protein GCM10012319_45660 [Comamonas sp. KCTC 72670]
MRIQAVLLAVLLMACGGGDALNEDAFVVRFEASYGECETGCVSRLEVSSEGEARVAVADGPGLPERTRSFSLTRAERAGLLEDVRLSRTEPWEERYGCPDCADQGTFILGLSAGADERGSTVDPMPHRQPAHLTPLLARLEALLIANKP